MEYKHTLGKPVTVKESFSVPFRVKESTPEERAEFKRFLERLLKDW
jgi:hypothetical protein